MELSEAILKRRSIRSFKSDSVSDHQLLRLLEAARWAPSGGNRQLWKFITVRNAKMIRAIKMFAEGLYGWPPLIIAVCSKKEGAIATLDLGMATENILLTATDLDLGGCTVASFSEEPIKTLLGVPEEYRIVLLVSIGRMDVEPKVPVKKSLKEIAYSEKWGGSLAYE